MAAFEGPGRETQLFGHAGDGECGSERNGVRPQPRRNASPGCSAALSPLGKMVG